MNDDALREAAAMGWDACVAAMADMDGMSVDLVKNENPYRMEKS